MTKSGLTTNQSY